ncbi:MULTISPECIES: COG4648 family protein [Methylomonas]|uniref:COG4648 family protein n=1 Tax=Methylomonas TaxID=416 RepID=UPI001232494C|nr:hypothetical protein [Methylomonas rhizoryzae]
MEREAAYRWPTAVLNGLFWLVTLSYPFLLWLLLDSFQPRGIALGLAGLGLLRLARQGKTRKQSQSPANRLVLPAAIVFLLFGAFMNDRLWLLSYPVAVSLSFAAVFAHSLYQPPTVVERLARLEYPNLPPHGIAYTRRVTQVWTLFFCLNAVISLLTALHGDAALWSLYNGCIFYVLMGILMGVEMLIRRKVKASF